MKLHPYIQTMALLAGLCLYSCSPKQKEQAKEEMEAKQPSKPNILLIFADDQQANTIHALGNDEVITPNIDKLVAEGTSFTQAYIEGSHKGAVCTPSRAMLLTGKHLSNLQGVGYKIPTDHTMLGETLQEAGYRCFGTGKYHNTPESYCRCFDQGENIFFGGMHDPWNIPLWHYNPAHEDKKRPFIENYKHSNEITYLKGEYVHSGLHASDLFSDAVIDFIKDYDDEAPFFAYLPFNTPHDPRSTHPKYRDMYDTAKISVPESFLPEHPFNIGDMRIRDETLAPFPRTKPNTKPNTKEHIRDYYACITHNDERIGDILQLLKDKGVYDNTIIIFAADNGLALGQHGLMGKQNMYDCSMKVPLIMAGPGIEANKQRDILLYLTDVYPTLCDLLGLNTPSSVDGISFVDAFTKDGHKHRDYIRTTYKTYQKAVRNEQYKLIQYDVKGEKNAQLFDLKQDPNEMDNLIDNPDLAQVREQLNAVIIE